MPGSQGEQDLKLSRKDSFNAIYALAMGHAMCFLPFLRRDFGCEALGRPGITAFIMMILLAGLGVIPDLWPFIGIWMLAMLWQRLSTMRAMQRGVIRHSRYYGDIATRLSKNPKIVKLAIEPLLCILIGACLEAGGCSHGLAMFVGIGAFSLGLVALIDRQVDDKRLQAMRDAAIEQTYLAARYRGDIE